MSRKTKPGLPDVDVVREVIRLDDERVVAECRSGPSGILRGSWVPERATLVDYLSRLPDVRMAELHALSWTGNRPSSTARAYDAMDQHAPRNLDHGAAYLTAKPLGEALRRGLSTLGLSPDRHPSLSGDPLHPVTHLES